VVWWRKKAQARVKPSSYTTVAIWFSRKSHPFRHINCRAGTECAQLARALWPPVEIQTGQPYLLF
jgi:hypothetical protein